MRSYTSAIRPAAAAAFAVASVAGHMPLSVRPAAQSVKEVRLPVLRNEPVRAVVISLEPLRTLTEADFSTITPADIALLESAMSTGVDDLDYSAFYDESL